MYVGTDFDCANPHESEVFTFDFVNDLAAGEIIRAAAWTCVVAADSFKPDAAPQNRLVGRPSTSGTKASHRLAGLLTGVKYVLQAVVTTDRGNTIELYSHVTCADPTRAR